MTRATMLGREPEDLAKRLGDAIPAGQEPAMFESMARVSHPDAADVLTVIGKLHPDKKIAKLARKSAYKAASRQAARRQPSPRMAVPDSVSSPGSARRAACSPRTRPGC